MGKDQELLSPTHTSYFSVFQLEISTWLLESSTSKSHWHCILDFKLNRTTPYPTSDTYSFNSPHLGIWLLHPLHCSCQNLSTIYNINILHSNHYQICLVFLEPIHIFSSSLPPPKSKNPINSLDSYASFYFCIFSGILSNQASLWLKVKVIVLKKLIWYYFLAYSIFSGFPLFS